MSGMSSRRRFAGHLLLGMAAPMIAPRRFWAADAPSNTIRVGVIGVGNRGGHLLRESIRTPGITVVALADVDRERLLRARGIAEEHTETVAAFNDYRRMLDRDDVDAVASATPDHWHAKVYWDSMDAGKDVYGEKPFSLTLNQGRNLVRKAKETGAVFQTGSQQRSIVHFRRAVDAIRNGRLGKIESVLIEINGGRSAKDVPPNQTPPPQLDWDLWLGPAPKVAYNPLRCHGSFRYFWDYSGGTVTDWGAHQFDIVQWALGMDGSGPVRFEGNASTAPGYFETFNSYEFTVTYGDGTPVHFKGTQHSGITFTGSKGTLFVNRGRVESNPAEILEEPLPESAPRVPVSTNHMQNWVDCIRTRELPICHAEVGHRSISIPHLCNICGQLGRPIEWDPQAELVIGDTEANAMLSREERPPFHHMAGV